MGANSALGICMPPAGECDIAYREPLAPRSLKAVHSGVDMHVLVETQQIHLRCLLEDRKSAENLPAGHSSKYEN